jgi:excisionase family DNA binding protein
VATPKSQNFVDEGGTVMISPDSDSPRRTLVTVPEVAAMLGCGRTLVYDLIGSRELPVVKVGRLTRVPVAAVDAFVSRHLTTTVSSPMDLPHRPLRTRSRRSSAVMAAGVAQVRLFDDALDR